MVLLDVAALLVGAEDARTVVELDFSLCGFATPWFGADGLLLFFGAGAACFGPDFGAGAA